MYNYCVGAVSCPFQCLDSSHSPKCQNYFETAAQRVMGNIVFVVDVHYFWYGFVSHKFVTLFSL